LEVQLELYWCGWYQEPPTDYAKDIAEGGAGIASALFEKLNGEKSETRQDLIVHIFEEMAKKNYLRGRRDVSEQLRKFISNMRDENIRSSSERRLEIIEGNL
jgi:hypothetical protein